MSALPDAFVETRGARETPTSQDGRRRVAAYYDACQILYSHFWSAHGVHYGLWDAATRSRREAIRNLDRRAAAALDLGLGSRVLDAGCGVGGTSLFLAECCGHDVTGITLSTDQLGRARWRARRSPARIPPRFAIGDYLATGFPDASFDGIVAIESSCYAESKPAFAAEAFRLLRPGGRLFVSDGFLARALEPAERPDFERLLRGFALDELAGMRAFERDLCQAGFADVQREEHWPAIRPGSRSIERRAWFGLAWIALPCALGLLPRAWLHHGRAGTSQRRLFERRAVAYCSFRATRPAA